MPTAHPVASHCPSKLLDALQSSIPQAELMITALPQCPAISLWLLDPNYPQWQLSSEQAGQIMANPPFWSFCWASGQVLAAHLMKHPELVSDKTLVDFGAGSGVVGIAACLAGAKTVIICDSDPVARLACQHNAKLNNVTLTYANSLEDAPDADIITVADVFYDRDNLPLLTAMQKRYSTLWVADSRLKGEALPGLAIVEQRESFTVPNLAESSEFNHVNIYTGTT